MNSPAAPRTAPTLQALVSPAAASTIRVTAENLRAWSAKSIYSLIDQGLTSLTGFFVSFFLARWLSAELFGAYAIAFAAYLFIAGFHNVILLEPISVFGPSRYATRLREYFRSQLILHVILCAALSVVAGLAATILWLQQPQSPLVGAIAGSALAIPFLLLLWLVRRMCYVLQLPRTAILGSSSCLALVLAGLYVLRHLDWLSPFSAFLIIGTGSLLGSCLIAGRIASTPSPDRASKLIAWRCVFQENWSYGRWLVGSAVLYSISGQVQMLLVAGFLGLGSAGTLRAMMLPAAVMTQVVTAADLLVLPGFAYDFSRGSVSRMFEKAVLLSCTLCATGIGVVALLWLIATPIEHTFFGGKFAPSAWLIPVLALVPAANGFNSGFSAVLRGSQKPHFDLLANALAAPVAVISALLFIHWWGLAGAAFSLVAGCSALAVVNFCSYCYFVRNSSRLSTAAPEQAFSPGQPS